MLFSLIRCVDCVKQSAYTDLANDLEINKAIMYLKQKEFTQVTSTKHHLYVVLSKKNTWNVLVPFETF